MLLQYLVFNRSTSNACRSSSAVGSKTIATIPSHLTRAAFFPIEASQVFPALREYGSLPGRMDPSLRITLILLEHRRWKSCTTLDHTEGIWHLRSAIRI